MSIDIRFNLSVDKRALEQLTPTMRTVLGKAVAKIARDIEGQAKAIVPVDTGFLKSSIQARPVGTVPVGGGGRRELRGVRGVRDREDGGATVSWTRRRTDATHF
jgi:hypothetical protein